MIFVTVGAQMPFDRLVRAVDGWASQRNRRDVFAQIGQTEYRPRCIDYAESLEPQAFRARCAAADAIVAHAGMGSILTALELGKPILVMPRRGDLRETRNDHQVATAQRLAAQGRVAVAQDEVDLLKRMDELGALKANPRIADHASQRLLDCINDFITDGARAPTGGAFDGVICFGGEDWWYHNRGHYDMQMMRQFSRHAPVLYVNSIGMRTPSVGEGKVFLQRLARKLRSFSRGLQRVDERFFVFSPVTAPRLRHSALGVKALGHQVRWAARRVGIRNPLLWVACPPACAVLNEIPHAALVYQRTDRFEAYPRVDAEQVRQWDKRLKRRAKVTLFCSSLLHEAEAGECRAALFVDHGVDFARFAGAAAKPVEPSDLSAIPRPRVGFVGGIDAHTFDPALFLDVAGQLSDYQFVMVGSCSLAPGWCPLPNVHFLGQKPYESVAHYMAGCDVLIMPWNRNEWIAACNPVKLKEYLAVGRPVVSTPFAELRRYDGAVTVAANAEAFTAGIRRAAGNGIDAAALRHRVADQTWDAKFDAVLAHLNGSAAHLSRQGA